MFRTIHALVLALPLVAASGAALAQYYPPPPAYGNAPPPHVYRDDPPPAGYRWGAPVRIYPQEADADDPQPLPPPGFGRAPQNRPGNEDYDEPNAPRPPSAVGPAAPVTGAVPPVSGQQRAGQPPATPGNLSALPPEDQPEEGQPKELPANLQKQLVGYQTKEPAGTIVVDTPNTYLYLVLGNGRAIRYGIGVGREGFTWAGTERISKMKEWPDWFPPAEMIERQPYLPRMMAGGPGNPLGARALYLGNTLYRIHGTNQPSTIGQTVSSGCIRLLNQDIEDLFSRVQVGTHVVVLPGQMPPQTAQANMPAGQPVPPPPQSNGAPSPTINGITGKPLPPAR